MAAMNFFLLIALCSMVYFRHQVKAECGGLIEETNGTITSPSYPSRYPANQKCIWQIRVPPSHRIKLHFKHFDLQEGEHCIFDSMTITSRLEDGSFRRHGKFCGSQIIPNITSGSNILLIDFKSDSKAEFSGFELEYFIDKLTDYELSTSLIKSTTPAYVLKTAHQDENMEIENVTSRTGENILTECGWVIEATNGTITSPLYPSKYPRNQRCTWEIKAPPKFLIKLHFRHFHLEDHPSCKFDSVSVKSKMEDGSVQEHGKFCGEYVIPNITSDSNILLIEFKSDLSNNEPGFKVEFSRGRCGGIIKEERGHVSSPFFPESYPFNKICEWSFILPPQHKMKLHFLNFDIEDGGDDCLNDFLLIQSKTDDGDIVEYGKYCGASWPPTIYSKDSIFLTFVSDRTLQSNGFKAKYTIDKWTDYELSTSLAKSTSLGYASLNSTTLNQVKNMETDYITSRNGTSSFSDAVKLLTEKVTSIEDNQKALLKSNENVLKNCEKLIFSLRQLLDAEP